MNFIYFRSLGTRSGRLAVTVDTSRLSRLGFSGKCCKYVCMGLSMFLSVAGIAILAAGAYVGKNEQIFDVVGQGFANAVIAVGVFLFITGAFGLAGALNENRLLLNIYAAVLVILLIILFVLGSFAVSKTGQELDVVGRAWQYLSNDERVHVEIFYICCGFNWATQLPGVPCPNGNPPPCAPMLAADYKKMAQGFGGTGIFLGIVALTGVISACCINNAIDKQLEDEAKAKSAEKAEKKKNKGRR